MWVELWNVIGRVSLEGMFELPHDPCGVPITLVHSHSDFPKRSYRYDLTSVATCSTDHVWGRSGGECDSYYGVVKEAILRYALVV